MDQNLKDLLSELEQFGKDNDAQHSERPRRMLNITRDTGELLAVLIRSTNAKRILEIGTSNGYSTLWLAWAAKANHGSVTTLEYSESKVALAAANFRRAGLQDLIQQQHTEAGAWLRDMAEHSVDLLFLDSERSEYTGWWPQLKRVLRPGGLLVVDNATSHAAEMTEFFALITADTEFTCCTVPVGNGEFLATRA